MGVTYTIGVVLFVLSVWAVIQLSLLGFFYSYEASTLVADVANIEFTTVIDYLLAIRDNFQLLSGNCYYAAYAYVLTLVASWGVIFLGRNLDNKAALEMRYGKDVPLEIINEDRR